MTLADFIARKGLKPETVVIEHKEDLHPQILVIDPKTHETLASSARTPGSSRATPCQLF